MIPAVFGIAIGSTHFCIGNAVKRYLFSGDVGSCSVLAVLPFTKLS